MGITGFQPLVTEWFDRTFEAPTEVQRQGWEAIASGTDTLVSAPTGSGKTLAAFLWAIDGLVAAAADGTLDDHVHIIYVSPLKALGNDIEKNLRGPLEAIHTLAIEKLSALDEIRIGARSGDTPTAERRRQITRPPHILITTPESLYILLTAERSREILRKAHTVILDEIHAVAQDKRGAHLALSVERLDRLTDGPLQRIGLSATQKPIEEVARLLVGASRTDEDGNARCRIVDGGHRREMDLSVEIPDFELGPIASHELQGAVYDRIAELVREHKTTLVFVNTRRLVERAAHALSERLGDDAVAAHHGSLSRETRLMAETGLKSGKYSVVVATASLELGIDVGHVDLVCHVGAPRALATLLQRVGRSGHFLGAIPKGILLPLTRDDLLQSAAAVAAIRAGELDRLTIPENSLDVMAQQIVASIASEELSVEEAWNLVRSAHPYRRLPRERFDQVIDMLAEGVGTQRGRRGAYLHYDRLAQQLRPRRGARLAAITSGGAIPDTADYDVVVEPDAVFVGKVNEDFAIESLAGDIFQLGNHSWRILRVESGKIRVEDAGALPPTIPFWLGESPGRTWELSHAVGELRRNVVERRADPAAAVRWLIETTGVEADGAAQLLRYLEDSLTVLGAMPTQDTVVAERFFDEAGGMQLVIHAPFGARINRAFGLALRKKFCVSFDFELQAAATDDGIVLSLGEQHSFPLENIFSMVRAERFEPDLTQAALQSPMFTNRWRWNATRALALLRFNGGRKVPVQIQRMRAEDLLGAVFPDQLGCQDNRIGNIELPDHPLVRETMDDCLHEAMDSEGLKQVLLKMEAGTIRTVAVETPAPSPLSHELLNANPYAFLDDAPLEERRARAVSLRRTDPELASGIGALDAAAITEVRRQAWPDARDADEVHDVLITLGVLPLTHSHAWRAKLAELTEAGRATLVSRKDDAQVLGFAAAERVQLVRAAYGEIITAPVCADVALPLRLLDDNGAVDPEVARMEIVRGWMDVLGPTSVAALAKMLSFGEPALESTMARLESQGVIMQGRYTTDAGTVEWCERGLLARIHRMTLGRLRREIEPVSPANFIRFLLRWQHVHEGSRLHGREGLRTVIGQLQGLELPAPAWEASVLPARIANYQAADLEQLCLAGEVAWGRLSVAAPDDDDKSSRRRRGPTRAAPLAFSLREHLDELLTPLPDEESWRRGLSATALAIHTELSTRGASFLAELARRLVRLPGEVEAALWELVAAGLVTGDGVAGLRTLLMPDEKRRANRARHLRGLPSRATSQRLMPVGRWSLLRHGEMPAQGDEDTRHAAALRLLTRYGVVLRELCARERNLPRWRELLWTLRRMEARGEVRGGRFVAGMVGEQFALPEAIDTLREVRRRDGTDEMAIVAAADPLNLVGILTPGAKISPLSGQVIAYRGGVPIETGDLGSVRSRIQRFTAT